MLLYIKLSVLIALYSLFYFLTYNQIFNYSDYPSDLRAHVTYIKTVGNISYPLWHHSVNAVSNLFNISVWHAAALFTSFLIVVIYIIIDRILELSLKDDLRSLTGSNKQYLLLFISFILLTSSAIYVPWFNEYLYIGQSSCGVWHNPTLFMVKPLAFLSFVFSVLYIQARKVEYALIGVFMTIASIYAKPSYIIAFLPALYLFVPLYIAKDKGILLKELFDIEIVKEITKNYTYVIGYLFAISLPSVLILISQFSTEFGDNANYSTGVQLDFFGVWSLYTPSVLISLLLTLAFPLCVFIFVSHIRSDMYDLSIVLLLVSIAWYAFVAQSGEKYEHGNFGWSFDIAYQLVFLFSVVKFIKGFGELIKWKKNLLLIILTMHAVSGLFYLGRILSGGPYF